MRRALLYILFAVLGAHEVRAQAPFFGGVACPGCTQGADLNAMGATAWAFKWPTVDGLPDIQFNLEAVGGTRSWMSLGGPSYAGPDNWRTSSVTPIRILVTNGEWLAWDTAHYPNQQDAGVVHDLQVVGALAGHLSPEVASDGTSLVVRWTPVREHDPDTTGACQVAGSEPGGFVIGYNVYVYTMPFPVGMPTLRTFVTHGTSTFADLDLLDFTVPDPDGLSGSDLDAADGLELVNPDGMRDTGDEILVLRAPPVLQGMPTWVRIQPVVAGDMVALATLNVPHSPVAPANVLLDLDGDTTLDAIDLLNDGIVDFIDESQHGLGLTHGGEILSSPVAGEAWTMPGAVPGAVTCTPRPPAAAELCTNGVDDDGDGATDCDDADCCAACAIDVAPPSFAGVTATRDLGHCDVEVSWDPATDDCSGVAGYNVYRDHGVGHAGDTLVAALVPASPHVDVTPGNGTWVYVVRAVDHAGNEDDNEIFDRHSQGSCTNNFPLDAGNAHVHRTPPPPDEMRGATQVAQGGLPRQLPRALDEELFIHWQPSGDDGGLHSVSYSVHRGTLAALRDGRHDHALIDPAACGLTATEIAVTDPPGCRACYYLVAVTGGDNATYGTASDGSVIPGAPACP